MELLIALAAIYGVGWATIKGGQAAVTSYRRLVHQRQVARINQSARDAQNIRLAQQSVERQQAELGAIQANRRMQLAVLNLSAGPDPDFRRSAMAAREAQAVPADFRRQQFLRLRFHLVRHYGSCLNRGCDPEVLFASLVELAVAYGMAEFEADYVRQEAERTRDVRATGEGDTATSQFQSRLTQLQRGHDQRMEVIRTLPNLSEDVRAQLLETEERRFSDQLFGRNQQH